MARSDAGQAARAQQGASPPAWLYQPSTGQHTVLPMDRPKLTIGRDAANDLSLDDPDVSRWHAVLLRTGSTWLIEDTASTNGTYVNGLRITSRTTLNNGDTLRVGNGLFSFGSQQPNPPKPPNPPKQSKTLRNAIIVALVLFVIGLLANSLNTYFERLQNTWLTWLLPNMVSAAVVVIGVLVNHFSSSGNQTEQVGVGGQPSYGQSPRPRARSTVPVAGVLAILLVLGVAALGVTFGVRYAVGYVTGREPEKAVRFTGQAQDSAGGVKVTVLRIYETDHFTRVEVTALSNSTIPKSLPLGSFCSFSGSDQTLESDPFRSEWTPGLARGVTQHGTITFSGHLSGNAQPATLSFTFGPDQPQVEAKLKARP